MKKKFFFTVLILMLTAMVFSDFQWSVLHTDYAKKMIVDELGDFYSINQIGVWKSTDEGETWVQTSYDAPPRDGHNTCGGATVTTDGIFVGALDNGVYYSSDNGNTWANTFSTGYGTGSRRMIPLGDSALMCYGGFLRGLYKWNPVSSSWYQTFTHSSDFFDFVQIPNGDIYATAGSPNHIGGIYKSSDNGENWSMVLQTQYYDNCKTIDYYDGILYYLSNNNEFWKSDDFGANWTLVSTLTQLSSTYITEDMYIAPNGTIFTSFGADNGVLFSTDFGVTWNFLNTGLPSLNAIDFTYYNGRLYVATHSGLCILGEDFSLPVTLSSFTAQFISNLPILCWTTQSETGNAGWNVYRGDYRDAFINGDAIQINPELIEGAGTTSIPTDYTFEDQYNVIAGNEYWYVLESVDYSGETLIHGSVSLTIPEEVSTPELPQQTVLLGNHPNPFNPETTISFMIKENETAHLSIFNLKGQNLESISFEAGIYNYFWDASSYASGIYLYKLKSESFSEIRKMILLK